ncbi:MAG TPA: amidohydrolase family protein [Streptosporangiaceae bacterium]|nr:amidohydrolase family protein [Streptosporangiaceae bacterium]
MAASGQDDVRLPLVLGPVSNGEFLPAAAGPGHVRLARTVYRRASRAADALAMDRRLFLQTAGGMAALLATINLSACSSPSARSRPDSGPGGRYRTPPPEELPECEAVLGSRGEFIFDVHTHHLMPSLPWRTTAPATLRLVLDMVPPDCAAANPLTCVDRAAYLHDMFLASDTTVALLSDLPSTGPSDDPLPFTDAEESQQLVDSLTRGGARRLLLQNVIAPNFGPLRQRLDGMTAAAHTGRLSAFKVYTAWGPGGRGYYLDDPAIGLPVIRHAQDLGVEVLCAHKGLPLLDFASTWNQPRDIVAVSRQFPDMQFVVYHAGWTPYHAEGPYDPANPAGVDSLIWALDRYRVPPNSNVWADVASVWRGLLAEPAQAAHVFGKLLSRLGEDRVLWGTDSVWYGPPQTQIMALRAFEISAEYQHRYGYPELTDAVKAKVFGLNAARLFGVDPRATRCVLAADKLELGRPAARGLAAEGALPPPWTPRGPVTRAQILHWRANEAGPWIPA